MSKVAILYICTGKYDVFWEEFYKTSQKYFLKNTEKHYFVFTDSEHILFEDGKDIHKIYQENLGWPDNTLLRFKIFKKIEEQLKEFDYIFFMNANLLFLNVVDESILPLEDEILVVKHPGYYNKTNNEFPYDRNPESLACIEEGIGEFYVAGGLNGGKASTFLKLINELHDRIDRDLEKDVIAAWHDESHLNKYILDKKTKILGPEYLYPEGLDLDFDPIILIRDKSKWGGHNFLRGKKDSIYIRLKRKIKAILKPNY